MLFPKIRIALPGPPWSWCAQGCSEDGSTLRQQSCVCCLQMMVSPTVASADPALEVMSKMRHISPGRVFYCRSLPALSDDLNTFTPRTGVVPPRGAELWKNLALSWTTVFLLVVLFSSVDPRNLLGFFNKKTCLLIRCIWASKYTGYLFSETCGSGCKNWFLILCVSLAIRAWHAHCNLLQPLWAAGRGPSSSMLSREEN